MAQTAPDARQYNNNDYTVGWICALPIELAAAKCMLDHQHAPLPLAKGDRNAYSLGHVGQHCVVMTCLPQGTIGIGAAASVAANLTRSFPKLRFVLMVGTAGGAPDVTNVDSGRDLRLGDIVVSKPMGECGGVLQYDFGKTIKNGIFKRTGTLDKPPASLRAFVGQLEATYLVEESAVPMVLSDIFRSKPKMAEMFRYPGAHHDLLFEAAYHHPDYKPNCNKCDLSRAVPRKPRGTIDPVIHYGLIASASQVMRDAITRDKLRQELGILCFEMEAAGLMDSCPCLVIRGIYNYSDTHKHEQWQPYAAITAAAYAKELLQTIPVRLVADEHPIQIVNRE